MTIKSTDDLLNESNSVLEAKTNPLHMLHQAIAAMPDIDPEKIAAVIKKLQNGTLDILGDESQRKAAEQRIAARIMEETLGDSSKSD